MSVEYTTGYKYQLATDYEIQINVFSPESILTDFIELTMSGQLKIKKGYAWDGASGPAIDTLSTIRGSLVHDALYELMRKEYISQEWREQADKELYRLIREDGMGKFRAYWWHRGVKKWAAKAASPVSRKKICEAP